MLAYPTYLNYVSTNLVDSKASDITREVELSGCPDEVKWISIEDVLYVDILPDIKEWCPAALLNLRKVIQ